MSIVSRFVARVVDGDRDDLPVPPAALCLNHSLPFVRAIERADVATLLRVAVRCRQAVASGAVDDRLCGLGGPSDHPITQDRDAIFDTTERRLRFRGFSRSDKLHISGAFTEACVAMNAPADLLDAAFLRAIWYVIEPAMTDADGVGWRMFHSNVSREAI